MARVATCTIWALFWFLRIWLIDANKICGPRSLVTELMGENAFDQGFSVCMLWLSVEVAVIVFGPLKGGISMLIAKAPKGFAQAVAERLSPERFRALASKRLTESELETMLKQKRGETGTAAE